MIMDHWRSFFNFIWQVQSGRRLVPTALGITLVRGYQCIDPDLCLPDIRGFIEHQITLIAKGQADHSLVVKHVLEQFKQKFVYFVKQIEHMDALFEAQFSPLSESGRAMSKCGKCLRYMKYISPQPPRLYCALQGTLLPLGQFRACAVLHSGS
uniref:DNA topoisomerase n=1 Tax=Opuntia streptacantha TaxID=393608 RepID=A0A7C9FND7_OPUST